MKTERVAIGIAMVALVVAAASWLRQPPPPPKAPELPADLDQRFSDLRSQVDRLRRDVERAARAPGAPVASAGGEELAALQAELARLKDIIQSTGLEQLADNGQLRFLSQLQDTVAAAEDRRDERGRLVLANRDQHQMDRDRYGARIEQLYRQAQGPRTGGPGGPARTDEAAWRDMEAAFQTLLEEYPDSYATGMVMAERALNSAMEMNTEDVEVYYQALVANERFSSVVTDRGFEAVPALQSFLVRSYIGEGRIPEAQGLIASMEENYGDSLVAERGAQGALVMRPVSSLAQELRGAISGANR